MRILTDDYILLSVLNTALRDSGCTLSELCEREDVDIEEIVSRMEKIGYTYDRDRNAFKNI